jgi:hypothetical protein
MHSAHSSEQHVRIGSKVDVCAAKADVRFGPIADIPCLVDLCDAAALAALGK